METQGVDDFMRIVGNSLQANRTIGWAEFQGAVDSIVHEDHNPLRHASLAWTYDTEIQFARLNLDLGMDNAFHVERGETYPPSLGVFHSNARFKVPVRGGSLNGYGHDTLIAKSLGGDTHILGNRG